ncbi:hypothetical protein SDC9_208308 [bioreactor metagenome]|uniref:DNA polymerase III beta sliding clamp C-terminal domain-containing protein n=1 Tax=bioreactor metagenome TaxID=1076179 RepID=A0A645JD37_9ZZZZ
MKYVTLNFTEEELKITAKNETLTIEDTIKCKLRGKDLEIAFDTKYLMDAIKNYKELKFNLISSVQAVLITDEYKTDLVLPVRIKKN